MKRSQLKFIQIQWCLFDGDKPFKAPHGVIIFGNIQTENNRTEKLSTKALTAWLLSELDIIRELSCPVPNVIQ